MAVEYEFPTDFPVPKYSYTSNCGDSFKESLQDSTVTTQDDAGYKKTRPRTTRVVATWTFAWMGVSKQDYQKLRDFWLKVRTSQEFSFKNWLDDKTYAVRFTDSFEWQYNHPYGWQGTLKFEEV